MMTRTFSLNRALVAACLTACVAACARSARAQSDEAFEPDPAAAKAFEEVVKAYRALPAVRVTSTLAIELSQDGTTSKGASVASTITWSRGGAGIVAIKGFTCWFKDGVVHAIHEKSADGYFRGEYEGSPYWELFSAFQDMPYPHLALLWGEEKMDEVWMQLELDSTPTIVPTQVSEVREGERVLERIVLAGTDGTLRIDVDPKTKLVEAMVHEVIAGPKVQAGAKRVTTYTIEHELFDAPLDATALGFVPGDRQRVDMLAALLPPPPAAPEQPDRGEGGRDLTGKPAPAFVLATASGGAVDLEELRGKVVVLDFWATWCPPCRKGLPGLHDVARWARAEELPVEILTVNTFEIGDPAKNTPDARLTSVKAFWEKSGFTLPVAMDFTDETAAAYGVTGIPATFVIRADGIVHAVHGGSGPDDVAWLKERIGEAIEAVEAPADVPADAPDEPAEGEGAPGAGS